MKGIFSVFLLTIATVAFGQSQIRVRYRDADNLMQAGNFKEAYQVLWEIESQCDPKDTLYPYILWHYTGAATRIEKDFRDKELFDSSLVYGLEALQLIQKAIPHFDEKFAAREYWMTKNIVVSYFGLGQLDNAQKYKNVLYQAYRDKKLPDGIDKYFNFTFFKWEDKNVWGYEWFEELPEDRFSKSFSKVVYYVYSTNPDGTDKEQLYRLHVLMFHKIDPTIKFDYVLTKQLSAAKNEVSGTLYAYTYEKNIDYKKLQADIREVLKGNYNPDTKSVIKRE